MFRSDLTNRLKGIFGFKKVTFSAPSESFEQDTLFVEVENLKTNASFGNCKAVVSGVCTVFAQDDKMPYGFFNKRIQQASADLKDKLFFEPETSVLASAARLQNISERRISFVFLYSEQYDPNQGELTSLRVTEEQD